MLSRGRLAVLAVLSPSVRRSARPLARVGLRQRLPAADRCNRRMGRSVGIVPRSAGQRSPGRGGTLPGDALGILCPSQRCSGLRVSGCFHPSGPTCRWPPSSIPAGFYREIGRRVFNNRTLRDGAVADDATRLLGFVPAGQPRRARHTSGQAVAALGFSSCRLCGSAWRVAKRARQAARTTALWPSVSGDAFTVPYPLMSLVAALGSDADA